MKPEKRGKGCKDTNTDTTRNFRRRIRQTPHAMRYVIKGPCPPTTPALRAIPCGGSAVPKALSEGYREQTGLPILQAWGMTETSPFAAVCTLAAADQFIRCLRKRSPWVLAVCGNLWSAPRGGFCNIRWVQAHTLKRHVGCVLCTHRWEN